MGFIYGILGLGLCALFILIQALPFYLVFLAGRWALRKAGILSTPAAAAPAGTAGPDRLRQAPSAPPELPPARRALLNYVRDALARGDSESSVIFDLCEKGWTAVEAGEAVALHRRLTGTAG